VPSAYSTARADLVEDRGRILDVWMRNRPHFSEQRYDWIYGDRSRESAMWLLRAADGATAGASALIHRQIREGGALYPFGQAVDLVVDAAHRTVGPALALQRAVTGSCASLGLSGIYAFPNARSEAVMLRSGYTSLGAIDRFTKPLRSAYKIDEVLPTPLLARTASFLVDAALRMVPTDWAHRRRAGSQGATVDAFGEAFDQLWSASCLPDGLRLGERDARYLTWRFRGFPQKDYRIFVVRSEEGPILGYAVWYVSKGIANIADLFALDQGAMSDFLTVFVPHVRREPVHALSFAFLGPAWLGSILASFGFFHRHEDAKIIVFVPPGGEHTDRFTSRNGWYLTEADRDV
jgi:hypothetical protein